MTKNLFILVLTITLILPWGCGSGILNLNLKPRKSKKQKEEEEYRFTSSKGDNEDRKPPPSAEGLGSLSVKKESEDDKKPGPTPPPKRRPSSLPLSESKESDVSSERSAFEEALSEVLSVPSRKPSRKDSAAKDAVSITPSQLSKKKSDLEEALSEVLSVPSRKSRKPSSVSSEEKEDELNGSKKFSTQEPDAGSVSSEEKDSKSKRQSSGPPIRHVQTNLTISDEDLEAQGVLFTNRSNKTPVSDRTNGSGSSILPRNSFHSKKADENNSDTGSVHPDSETVITGSSGGTKPPAVPNPVITNFLKELRDAEVKAPDSHVRGKKRLKVGGKKGSVARLTPSSDIQQAILGLQAAVIETESDIDDEEKPESKTEELSFEEKKKIFSGSPKAKTVDATKGKKEKEKKEIDAVIWVITDLVAGFNATAETLNEKQVKRLRRALPKLNALKERADKKNVKERLARRKGGDRNALKDKKSLDAVVAILEKMIEAYTE